MKRELNHPFGLDDDFLEGVSPDDKAARNAASSTLKSGVVSGT